MWKKRLVAGMLAICAIGMIAGCGGSQGDSGAKKKIGVVQLVEHPALDEANKGFVDALKKEGIYDKVVIDQENAQGDQSNLNSIAQKFTSEKDDLILAIATPAAQSMANATHTTPILGTAITDYLSAKLVKSNEKPGTNVSGTTDMNPVKEQVDLMLQFLPNLKKVGVIYSSSEVNSQVQVDRLKEYAKTKGIDVVEVTVSNNVNDIQQAAQNLVSQGVQAVYVPTDNVIASAFSNLVRVTNAAKIPVFPAESNEVKMGGLATYSVDYYKLGYQTGLMAAKILKGEAKVEEMPIESQKDFKLVVNQEQAKLLGIKIPAALQEKLSK